MELPDSWEERTITEDEYELTNANGHIIYSHVPPPAGDRYVAQAALLSLTMIPISTHSD